MLLGFTPLAATRCSFSSPITADHRMRNETMLKCATLTQGFAALVDGALLPVISSIREPR